jgi:hypothetical protein
MRKYFKSWTDLRHLERLQTTVSNDVSNLPEDYYVNWRLNGVPTGASGYSLDSLDIRHSRPNFACDAFICSGFRHLARLLTVFPGTGIAGKFLPSEIPSKSFACGREVKILA